MGWDGIRGKWSVSLARYGGVYKRVMVTGWTDLIPPVEGRPLEIPNVGHWNWRAACGGANRHRVCRRKQDAHEPRPVIGEGEPACESARTSEDEPRGPCTLSSDHHHCHLTPSERAGGPDHPTHTVFRDNWQRPYSPGYLEPNPFLALSPPWYQQSLQRGALIS